MIRKLVLIAIAVLASAAVVMAAEEAAKETAKKAPATLTGELVDTGCYMARGAHGEKHIECATKCIGEGMPMGLLTSGGQLYLLTLNHDNPDAYNSLKKMAGKNVSVTGLVISRSGMQGIDVTEAKLAAAQPAASK